MPTPSRTRRALLTAALLPTLVVGVLTSVASSAAAATAPVDWSPSDRAATWLASELAADSGGWSPGSYADVVLGLAASDGDRAAAVTALGRLEALVPTWVKPTSTTVDAAAAAKAMLAVHALQGDPHDFGGLDLEALLRSTMRTDPGQADPGRFGIVTVFGQSLAVLALQQAGSGAPALAQQWLRSKQCPDGGFSATTCASADADHTALAAQALRALGSAGATEAGSWLVAHQAQDGGFGAGSNANSTGLAGQALRALAQDAAAERAAARIRALQKTTGDGGRPIAFRSDSDGDLLFATTQGVLAWGAPRLDLVRFPDVIGEPCAVGSGVTVVVDLTLVDGTVRVGCSNAASPTGSEALESAGFAVTYQTFTFGRFVCSINDLPNQTAGQDCGGPGGIGYWGYWQAASQGAEWVASFNGSDATRPVVGSVEGWRFDPDFNTSSLPPRAATSWPTATISGPSTTLVNQPTTLTVGVSIGSVAVDDGLVQVLRDGAPLGSPARVEDGSATVTYTPSSTGPSTFTARYLGSPTSNPRQAAGSVVTTVEVGSGYWTLRGLGAVEAHGNVPDNGDLTLDPPASPVIGMAETSSGDGYWLTTSRGHVTAFGDAADHGNLDGIPLNKPIVGIVATPSGRGYWLVASDGGVFAFGDADFLGSAGALPLNAPVVGIIATSSGNGYLLAAADGGVFTYGDAVFGGSLGDLRLNKPVVGIMAEPGQPGYLLVASDGGVFALGGSRFRGSAGDLALVAPVVGGSAVAGGYRLIASDGGVFTYDVPFLGTAPCSAVSLADGRCAQGPATAIASR